MATVSSITSTALSVLGGYLAFNVGYLLAFSVAGHRRTRPMPTPATETVPRRVCVLMPAYQADEVISETAPQAQRHHYAGQFDVHIIADGLQSATVQNLRQQGLGVIEVAFEKSTKGKALLAAFNQLPTDAYDLAVVLDVDNVMGANFLNQANIASQAGYRVIQGHRTAKNLDSPFAILDACNEEINNHIFRQGHVALGLSSALIGSGMAFEYGYLHQLLRDIGETPGEDKELEFKVLANKTKISYLPEALVLDEKIPNSKVFTAQRTRWLAAQKEFLSKYFVEGLRQLAQGNLDFFDKVMQTLLLPRVLLLGAVSALLGLSLVVHIGPGPGYWAALLSGTAAALLLALPKYLYTKQVGQAVLHLPTALWGMVLALAQMRKAKSSFMHTPHATMLSSSSAH